MSVATGAKVRAHAGYPHAEQQPLQAYYSTVPLKTVFDQTIVCVGLVLQVNVPLRAYLSTQPDLRIVSVACGHSHTLAIAETGSVWSCGRNGDGQ